MGSTETLLTPAGHNMGTKLSRPNNSPLLQVEDKSLTLPPPTNNQEQTDVTAKSETLPRSGFERSTTGLGKSFRKSMRKLVGKKKVKEEEAEKKESTTVKEKSETAGEKEGDQEENFKTAQQKARAEFFKEMYTEKEEKEEEVTASTETEAKEEEEAVNVSLIGTPVEESQQETSPREESVEAVERDAANEMLDKHQSGQESSNLQEKSDEMKKPDDDVNNEEGN